MITTPNMSLTAWDLATDPYDHTQLANNWSAIDVHDHSPGKGVPISGAGLEDASVDGDKLVAGAVDEVNLADDAVTAPKIADGVLVPVGTIIPWWRPNGSTPVPTGWLICNGQAVTAGNHDFSGGGTINLPDLRAKFLLGADTSGTGSGANQPPAIGQGVGSNEKNLQHTHTVDAHTHTVTHSHTVNSHSHGISSDGGHSHGFYNGFGTGYTDLKQRTTGVGSASGTRQTLYTPGLNAGGTIDFEVDSPMEVKGAHSHGGGTGAAAPSTSSDSPTTSSASPSTQASGSATQDIRPNSVGVLFIMKVKG